ncbi:hypothetical protein Tco_0238959, partial [Tanacetum coccineum]
MGKMIKEKESLVGYVEVDLARAIKVKQVDDHDDDALDTLNLENKIKKLEEDFGRLLKEKKAKESKKAKEAKKTKEAKKAKEVELAKQAKKTKEDELKAKEAKKAKEAELKAKKANEAELKAKK